MDEHFRPFNLVQTRKETTTTATHRRRLMHAETYGRTKPNMALACKQARKKNLNSARWLLTTGETNRTVRRNHDR